MGLISLQLPSPVVQWPRMVLLKICVLATVLLAYTSMQRQHWLVMHTLVAIGFFHDFHPSSCVGGPKGPVGERRQARICCYVHLKGHKHAEAQHPQEVHNYDEHGREVVRLLQDTYTAKCARRCCSPSRVGRSFGYSR